VGNATKLVEHRLYLHDLATNNIVELNRTIPETSLNSAEHVDLIIEDFQNILNILGHNIKLEKKAV